MIPSDTTSGRDQPGRWPMAGHSVAPGPRLAGFTLFELLVVMVLVALISTILMQTLGQVWRIQERSGMEIARMSEQAMLVDWYSETIRGLMPDYERGKHVFVGDARGFRGLSVSPLGKDYGAPAPITWKLSEDPAARVVRLLYQDEPILEWTGASGFQFAYLDGTGALQPSWPPAMQQVLPLPAAVVLIGDAEGEPIRIAAAPRGPKAHPRRQFGLLRGAP